MPSHLAGCRQPGVARGTMSSYVAEFKARHNFGEGQFLELSGPIGRTGIPLFSRRRGDSAGRGALYLGQRSADTGRKALSVYRIDHFAKREFKPLLRQWYRCSYPHPRCHA